MADLVDPDSIERLVGVPRHATAHYGRAVTADQTVYVLHSQECKDSTPDLRTCPYSAALDRGITASLPWASWRRLLDRPIRLHIFHAGWLVPDLAEHMRELDRVPDPASCAAWGEAHRG